VIATLDERAFGFHYQPGELDDLAAVHEPERFLLASDPGDGTHVGVTGSYPFTITMPGGARLPVEGLTWVSVAPTHRRRGVLRAMLVDQHRRFVTDGVPLAILTASEGGIYGRFGYQPVSRERTIRIDRRSARLRPDVPDPGGVRMVDRQRARALAPAIHRRWAATTPGAITRSDPWWDYVLAAGERTPDGDSALFHLVHPDGYASYQIGASTDGHRENRSCRVIDFFPVTDEAQVALYRVLLALDLIDTVTGAHSPLDDPLAFLLTDPRHVRTTNVRDGLWARILDVPTVLAARRYPVEIDTVLEVTDYFLDLGGRFRLQGGSDGAQCRPVSAPARARLSVGSLAQLVFGSCRAVTLARAGLLDTDAAECTRLDTAFTTEREVRHGTHF
jgi:predicted acetyltransferase